MKQDRTSARDRANAQPSDLGWCCVRPRGAWSNYVCRCRAGRDHVRIVFFLLRRIDRLDPSWVAIQQHQCSRGGDCAEIMISTEEGPPCRPWRAGVRSLHLCRRYAMRLDRRGLARGGWRPARQDHYSLWRRSDRHRHRYGELRASGRITSPEALNRNKLRL